MNLAIFKKLNLRFFYVNIIFVILFAVLYYLQDVFVSSHQELAQKLWLLRKDKTHKNYSDQPSPFYYYMWFSLMTQTTVGYGGADNTVTGKAVTFIEEPNRLAKIINGLQLLSILFAVSIA
jgi:hypothetical protein